MSETELLRITASIIAAGLLSGSEGTIDESLVNDAVEIAANIREAISERSAKQ